MNQRDVGDAAADGAQSLGCLLVDAALARARVCRPPALDEGEHCPDFPFAQRLSKSRHVTLVAFRRQRRLEAQLRDTKQDLVGMMPGMAGLVVRGRRQSRSEEHTSELQSLMRISD